MSRAVDTLYVRYQLTDLDRQKAFLTDFGLAVAAEDSSRLLMRGTGSAPFIYVAEKGPVDRFVGAGLLVSSAQDLDALARLPGSGPVEAIEAPGGGRRVRMRMDDGFEIDAVHGIARSAASRRRSGWATSCCMSAITHGPSPGWASASACCRPTISPSPTSRTR
jgi:hypothetical protein